MRGGSTEFRQALRDANWQMALEMQGDVVDHMRGQIRRRNVSSGRLLTATADRRNIEATEFHYAVGREEYLNKSIAKYWRTIEEGSQVVWADVAGGRPSIVGMELRGLWGGSIGRVTADRVHGARPWSRHSPRRGDMFVPMSRTFNFRGKWTGTGGKGGGPNLAGVTTVKNEIDPHYDYRNAYLQFQPGRRSLQELNQLLRSASAAAWHVT